MPSSCCNIYPTHIVCPPFHPLLSGGCRQNQPPRQPPHHRTKKEYRPITASPFPRTENFPHLDQGPFGMYVMSRHNNNTRPIAQQSSVIPHANHMPSTWLPVDIPQRNHVAQHPNTQKTKESCTTVVPLWLLSANNNLLYLQEYSMCYVRDH